MVRKRSRVRVPPSAPLKKATVYRAFFIFQNLRNQSIKFDWLSEKRPLAVRYIVKIRLNFSKIHLPSPICPNRPKTPCFSPIGYIWLSAFFDAGNGIIMGYSFVLTFIVLCVIIQTRDKINGLGMLDIEETT